METKRMTEAERRLPSWDRLPDIELYMDQVLLLVDRSLQGFPGYDERGLTASMVNNYVKQGVLPPPKKKRYGREHLACLLMICLLKPALPISAIKEITESQTSLRPLEQVYTDFQMVFGEIAETAAVQAVQDAAGENAAEEIWRASLRAAAEQARAARLFRDAFGADDGRTQSDADKADGEKR